MPWYNFRTRIRWCEMRMFGRACRTSLGSDGAFRTARDSHWPSLMYSHWLRNGAWSILFFYFSFHSVVIIVTVLGRFRKFSASECFFVSSEVNRVCTYFRAPRLSFFLKWLSLHPIRRKVGMSAMQDNMFIQSGVPKIRPYSRIDTNHWALSLCEQGGQG